MSPGGILSVAWGRPYACDLDRPSYDTPVGHVWMFRKGQRCRFYDRHGDQVGPEQRNVAPALVYAASEGWIDPEQPDLSVAMILEVRGKLAESAR